MSKNKTINIKGTEIVIISSQEKILFPLTGRLHHPELTAKL